MTGVQTCALPISPLNRPEILHNCNELNEFDTIYIGFPIWWYDAPRIIYTFLESYDFKGKTIIPFATSGGSEMDGIDEKLKQSIPDGTDWCKGIKLASDANEQEILKWLTGIGI